jgi:hypothetical protein
VSSERAGAPPGGACPNALIPHWFDNGDAKQCEFLLHCNIAPLDFRAKDFTGEVFIPD